MYFLITSFVTLSPTVRTKYPSSQNSPPQSSCFTSGCSWNITLALILFNIPTTLEILCLGGNERKIWTWSSATSSVSISKSWLLEISLNISFIRARISLLKIHFRYFGAHTKWYFVSYTAWLVLFSSSVNYNTFFPAFGRRTFHPRLQNGVFKFWFCIKRIWWWVFLYRS